MIGYEFEFFVIDVKTNQPINGRQFDLVHRELKRQGWKNYYDPISKGLNYSKKTSARGDIALKSDVVIHIFELNMPPCETIQQADKDFRELIGEVKNASEKANCKLFLAGGFPSRMRHSERTRGNDSIIYDIQLKETVSDWYIIAGNHIWLDVEPTKLIDTMNLFNRLSGVMIALFGNSGVICEEVQPNIEQRSIIPERGVKYGFAFGVPKKPYKYFWEHLDLILNSKFYFLIDQDEICFYLDDRNQKLTYLDYLGRGKHGIIRADSQQYKRKPLISDVEDLLRRNFIDMRPKFRFKKDIKLGDFLEAFETKNDQQILNMFDKAFLEIRVVPCQRLAEISCAAAFALGLQSNLDSVTKYLDHKPYTFWVRLRQMGVKNGLNFLMDEIDICKIAQDLVELSRDGLAKRGFGEEKYLGQIMVRIRKKQNLGQENKELFQRCGLESFINENAP